MAAEIVERVTLVVGPETYAAGTMWVDMQRNPLRRHPVAYAELGKTTVSIGRGTDGKVRVEIQDEADEPVYVSINAFTATADMSQFTPERPWNER
jgi:hypothetical protein